ncbi:tetratricopeptide repeat protein, partial [Planctomycetota bacterium]
TAEVFREQGKFAESIRAYEALIKRYPKEASANVVYWLGQLSLEVEPPDTKRGETYFRRFTDQFKDHPYFIWAAFGLAEALNGGKKNDDAWEWYQKVEKLAPHVIADAGRRDALVLKCQLQMGRMAYDSKRWEFARRYLLRIGYLAGGDQAAEALYKAGVATWQLKDTHAAVAVWQRLLRIHPESTWTKTMLQELAKFGVRLKDDGKTLEPTAGAGATVRTEAAAPPRKK